MSAVAAPRGRTIEQLLQSVSASRLTTFHGCRLKFYFRYVLGLATSTPPALFIGSAVHHVLSIWNKARWRKQVITQDDLNQQLNTFWSSPQRDPVRWDVGEAPAARAEAWSLVKLYLRDSPIPPNEPAEGVEVRGEADLSIHGLTKLVGVLDLVRPGGLVVDFKTAAQTPNPDKVEHLLETQLSSYGVLYREATGRMERGFELHHLVKLKKPKLVVIPVQPMTEHQRTRLFRQVESYLEGVRRQDWVPSPNPMSCVCCEFFGACRRWNGTALAKLQRPPIVISTDVRAREDLQLVAVL